MTREIPGDYQLDPRLNRKLSFIVLKLAQLMAKDMRGFILAVSSMGTMNQHGDDEPARWQIRRTYRIAVSRNAQVLKPWQPRHNGFEIYQQPWKYLQKTNTKNQIWCRLANSPFKSLTVSWILLRTTLLWNSFHYSEDLPYPLCMCISLWSWGCLGI